MGATLAALKTVALKGCTVTGDALHCHPENGSDGACPGRTLFCSNRMGNHGPLLAAAEAAFAVSEATGTLKWCVHDPGMPPTTASKPGGCYVFAVPPGAPGFPWI